jgi:hypothetical protein
MQGYFGVKVTPLGSTLTLLEEQEEGEIQALMVDAKEWLDDWFQEIRPWSPKKIDRDRIIWLRIYGIPAHAWNDQFFVQVTKPWGIFMNTDDVTSKKLSMDVARVMIRSSCQIVVDEFLDVKINGDIFHVRVLEDSYGPMRIPLPQKKAGKVNSEDEDDEVDEEEEEEEEDEEEEMRLLKAGEEDKEGESEGEGENLWAFNSLDNSHNESTNIMVNNAEFLKEKETRVEDSFNTNNEVVSHNSSVGPLIEEGRCAKLKGGTAQQDSLNEKGRLLLGQKGCVDGPAKSICSLHTIAGGVESRLTQSENLGCFQKPNFLLVRESGGKGEMKRGVYSDGPRSVYKKLNFDPKNNSNALKKKNSYPKDTTRASVLPSASLRTQQRLTQALSNKSRKPHTNSSSSFARPTLAEVDTVHGRRSPSSTGVRRNSPTNSGKKSSNSLSSAGEILCCSSINSSDIRNCNNKFLKKHNHEIASKVWKGAVELGVEGDEEVEGYVDRIVTNEGREDEARIQREHRSQFNP